MDALLFILIIVVAVGLKIGFIAAMIWLLGRMF